MDPYPAADADVVAPDLVTFAEARARGLPRSRMGKYSAARVTYDLYSMGAPPTPWQVASGLARMKAGVVVNGVTAAQRHGFRLPLRLQHQKEACLNLPPRQGVLHREGMLCTRRSYAPDQVQEVDGVMVTSPAQTLLELTPLLVPDEWVVAADGLVNCHAEGYSAGHPPMVPLERLEEFVRARRGQRWIARFAQQLERVRVGSDSAPETRLRLQLADHGIGHLVPGHPVFDDAGQLMLQADLADVVLRIAIQYDGLHHDDAGQRERDIARARRTSAVGWQELRISADDMARKRVHRGRTLPLPVVLYLELAGRRRADLE